MIIVIFIIAFFVQSVYYLLIYIRVLFHSSEEISYDKKPISVIVSARNEADNLKKNLPKILNQEYAQFELIVINDRSEDDTANVLDKLKQTYHNLTITTINDLSETGAGKKRALTEGIKFAKNEYLVFTDADCYPVSKRWLKLLAATYKKDTEIVLAYGAYEDQKTFLNKIIRFETLTIALQYMSYSLVGMTYMGVGRNLSYKKSVYRRTEGFKSHMGILSGDDDLFVNEAADKKNTTIILNKESITRSEPKKSFKEYIVQKRRHLLTGRLYKKKHQIFLGTEIFSRFFFYFIGLICLLTNTYPTLILSAVLVRLIMQIIIIGVFSKMLNEKKVLIFIPIFDILIPLINLYIVVSNIFIKAKDIVWK